MNDLAAPIYLSKVSRYFRNRIKGFELDFYREGSEFFMKKISSETGRIKIYQIKGYAESPTLTLISNIKPNSFFKIDTRSEEEIKMVEQSINEIEKEEILKEVANQILMGNLKVVKNFPDNSSGKSSSLDKLIYKLNQFL